MKKSEIRKRIRATLKDRPIITFDELTDSIWNFLKNNYQDAEGVVNFDDEYDSTQVIVLE